MTDPHRRLAPVVRLAPAKLNLTLAVIGRRPDGYHELHSVMASLGLSDRLSMAPSAAAADSLHVVGPDLGPPERNLVVRAIAEARSPLVAGGPATTRPRRSRFASRSTFPLPRASAAAAATGPRRSTRRWSAGARSWTRRSVARSPFASAPTCRSSCRLAPRSWAAGARR